MVGPVNYAGAQQTQIANPFQQQNNRQVEDQRQQERNSTQASQTQETGGASNDTGSQSKTVQTASASQPEQSNASGRDQERGSLLDIKV